MLAACTTSKTVLLLTTSVAVQLAPKGILVDSSLMVRILDCLPHPCLQALPLTVSAVAQPRSCDLESGKGPTVSPEGAGRWYPVVEGMLGLQPS